MTSARTGNYKGYEIQVEALAPAWAHVTFRGKYEVRDARSNLRNSGVIAGPFPTAEEAENAAIKAAIQSIDC